MGPPDGGFAGPRPLLRLPCLLFSPYGPGAPPRWGLRGAPTSFATPLLTFLALWSRCTPPMGASRGTDLFCDSPAYFSRSMVPVHPPDGGFAGHRPLLRLPCLLFSLYGPGAPPRWGLRGTPTSFAIPLLTFLALWSQS